MTRLAFRTGFTLIEALIALAIAAILLVLAAPGYFRWLADSEILNSAQSVAGGLRTAQAEAIKRNGKIEFSIDKTTGSGSWEIRDLDGNVLQTAVFREGSYNSAFSSSPSGSSIVTFNGLGGIDPENADSTAPFTSITVDSSSGVSGTHPLTVLVGNGRTGIKICNGAYTWPDPKACPPSP